ncbi:MAG: class I SAM-dependent methyltransferase [Dorea sp.]|nr:class I SAM-dependent methyltransferase [Dorea sp.]
MAKKKSSKNLELNIENSAEKSVLKVFVSSEDYLAEGQALAAKLDTELIKGYELSEEALEECNLQLLLRFDQEGVSLTQGKLSLRGDFMEMMPRLKSNNLYKEMLVKASKLKGFEGTPYAIDATAGMGEDSILLATAGFEVDLYEFDPVIAALLKDALRRAADDPILGRIVARMHVVEGNSVEAMWKLGETASSDRRPDLIYLDPMFPARQKSGLIKKKFQLLQQLERPCSDDDGDEMVRAAMSIRPRKLVIKRPLKGPYLADLKPEYSLAGKAIRYDCFTFARNEMTKE